MLRDRLVFGLIFLCLLVAGLWLDKYTEAGVIISVLVAAFGLVALLGCGGLRRRR